MKIRDLFQEAQQIESDILYMRPVSEEDAEALLPMYSDASIYRYRPGMPRNSLPLVVKVIKRFRQSMEKGETVAFTVFDKRENGMAVGLVEVFNVDARVEQVEIGYTVIPRYQNRGIAAAAIGSITDYLIWEIGFNRVRATVHVDNQASQKALLKNGYTLEGRERQGEFWQGIGFVDICRFAKLKIDYEVEEGKK